MGHNAMQACHLPGARKGKKRKEKPGGGGGEERKIKPEYHDTHKTHLPVLRRQVRHILNQSQASVCFNLRHEAVVQDGKAPVRGDEKIASVRILCFWEEG